ncbi:MAG: DUF975 family protein [Lachnospiraceae bacterium]|nr:DUF975 family protein [Lachnospiraceae bacterium]
MNRKILELKRIARGNLTFKYKVPMLAVLFSYLASVVINTPFSDNYLTNPTLSSNIIFLLASLLSGLLLSIIMYGQIYIHLKLARLGDPKMGDIFVFFKNQPDRYLLGSLLMLLIVVCSALPFYLLAFLSNILFYESYTLNFAVNIILMICSVLACLLACVKLTMFPFFLVDRTDLSITECFLLSNKKSHGQLGRLIKIHLSFLGFYLLSVLSMGIGFVWVLPYVTQTFTVLYLDIIGELSSLEYQKMKPSEN